MLQARLQLKAIYKDNADTIIGNMDCQVFLGGSESTTLKEFSEALGKETIDTMSTSDTRGNSPSYGTNYQKLGKELLYSSVVNSDAHNKTMNRDTTSGFAMHRINIARRYFTSQRKKGEKALIL